jgi:hypothetical protein
MDGNPVPPARDSQPKSGGLAIALAGLEGGMVGVLWMLAWMGISSAWEQRSFWGPENLFATAFYGGSAYGMGFARSTFSGLALYLLLYSLLGALFAVVVRVRLSRLRILMFAVLFGAAWYFVSFRLIWKTVMPLAYLLHSEHPTFLGHLIYGTFLGRFPLYLEPSRPPVPANTAAPGLETPPAAEADPAPATPAPAQSSSPPDPV